MPDYDDAYPKEGEGKPTERPSGISKSMAPISTEGMERTGKLAVGLGKVYKQLGSDYYKHFIQHKEYNPDTGEYDK